VAAGWTGYKLDIHPSACELIMHTTVHIEVLQNHQVIWVGGRGGTNKCIDIKRKLEANA
jgi:hypothetical protein